MVNRTRNKRVTLRFSEEELDDFKKRKVESSINNYSDFVLNCVNKIPIFDVNTKPFLTVSEQISKIGTNINQIAKVANTTQNIYENDINELQKKIKELEDIVTENFRFWSKIRGGKLYGIYKNKTD